MPGLASSPHTRTSRATQDRVGVSKEQCSATVNDMGAPDRQIVVVVTVTPLQARRQFPTVSLQTDSLFKNIIQSDRGGYCFEQNLLFAAALKACGFSI